MRVQERISRLFYAVCIALTLLLALLLVFAGGSGQDDAVKGEEVVMRHSALLRIVDCDGFSAVEVKNPWGNGLLKRYLLVHADSAFSIFFRSSMSILVQLYVILPQSYLFI